MLNPATGSSQGLTSVEHFNTLVYIAASVSQTQPSGISQMSNPTQGLNSGPTLSSYSKELLTNTRPKKVHYGDQVLSSQVVPASFMAPHSVTYDSLFLPRPEFSKFAGDPLEFQLFISNFETHIEPRVQCERTLFCLLISHFSRTFIAILSQSNDCPKITAHHG